MIRKEEVEEAVARVIKLLESPRLAPCRNNSVIRNARRVLIAQIFWADRVIAAIRDNEDYRIYAENMQAIDLAPLNEFVDCMRGECNGR